jgi:hypothetical protein
MKNAQEMLKLTNDSRAEQVISIIEKEALKGHTWYSADHPYERNLFFEYKDVLESYGYKVEIKEKWTTISWDIV